MSCFFEKRIILGFFKFHVPIGPFMDSKPLYAYIKIEDIHHKQALQISKKSVKAIIIFDTWLSAFSLYKNTDNLKLFKSNILSHHKELEELMYDGDIMYLLSLIYKNDITYRKKIIECIRDLTSFYDEIKEANEEDFERNKKGHIDNYPQRSMYRFLQNIDFIFKELKKINTYDEVFNKFNKLEDTGYIPSMLEELEEFKKSANIRLK